MRTVILGAPIGLGGREAGAGMGPSAMRHTGLVARLHTIGHEVVDMGDLELCQLNGLEPGKPNLKYLEPIRAACTQLANKLVAIGSGVVPIILGGDHSVSLGSVTSVAQTRKQIGILWVDAHGDFNTGETTPSGNIHSMVLAALAGVGDPRLTGIGGFCLKALPHRIVILGARSLDAGERNLLRQHDIHVFTQDDIGRCGLMAVTQEAITFLTRDGVPLHVSFDIDVVDPQEAPGVGTPWPDGITAREAHTVMKLIADSGAMCSLDLVEVDPLLDHKNQTDTLAVDLICSAFGGQVC